MSRGSNSDQWYRVIVTVKGDDPAALAVSEATYSNGGVPADDFTIESPSTPASGEEDA